MKKCITRGIASIALAGLVLTSHAQDTNDQSQFPTIIQQPVDQCVSMASTVTFAVQATNVDSYQWYCNGNALNGQTNSSMTIPSAGTSDVGYYFASVIKGSEVVPTRSACLNVYVVSAPVQQQVSGAGFKSMSMNTTMQSGDLGSGGVITVFGAPVAGNGGGSSCPGKYSGYVNFTKTASQGWGWTPTAGANSHTASDTNRLDTKIQYGGDYGDSGCAATTISIPNPTMSPVYRFSIYFPVGSQVPTNAYPITLTGFDP